MLVFIFQERFRRMMATHEEFQMLPNQTKLQICQKNLPMAAALTMAKLESCATGLDQVDTLNLGMVMLAIEYSLNLLDLHWIWRLGQKKYWK